jgi:hypothetical protein
MDIQNYEAAVSRLKKQQTIIETAIKMVKKRLRSSPEGSLRVEKKGNIYQYYHRRTPDEVRGIYIARKNQALASALAQKNYDTNLLEVLESQLNAIKDFLKSFDPNAVQRIYSNLSAPRRALIDKGFLTDEEFVAQWQAVPYQRLGFRKDDPEYYTQRGERVRSKSEILIADALYRHNIPYRYEYPLYVDGVLVAAPDFNCLNVRLRKEHYWEHLGMMGDKDYVNHNVKKLERYSLARDFDESGLILTFETESQPINTRVIEEKIRKYLM